MRALIRRSAGRAEPVYEHEGVSIDPQSREVTVNGAPVTLTAREWAVLEPLIARPGMIYSRAQLEESSTAGRTASAATPSRYIFMACARNWVRT